MNLQADLAGVESPGADSTGHAEVPAQRIPILDVEDTQLDVELLCKG